MFTRGNHTKSNLELLLVISHRAETRVYTRYIISTATLGHAPTGVYPNCYTFLCT